MAPLKNGDSFPSGVSFQYIPWAEDKSDVTACGIPIKYDASKEWADKKVVLFSVPGEFSIVFLSTLRTKLIGSQARSLPPAP